VIPIDRRQAADFPRRPTGDLPMNLTISGHHLEVTPALRDYVATKLDRITRHFDQVVDIRVLLTVEKQKEKERRQRAECMIHVKGNDLFAESSHADLYAALDDLVDKLDRQVGRHKTRLQDHSHETPKRLM
jgi:putative sigma-54 modulation protein